MGVPCFSDSTSECVLAWVQSALQSFRIRRVLMGPLIRCPSNIVDTIDWRLSSRESFKSDQLRLIGSGESREVGEREMIQRTALAKYR